MFGFFLGFFHFSLNAEANYSGGGGEVVERAELGVLERMVFVATSFSLQKHLHH